jgi:microcystin-dependent protein
LGEIRIFAGNFPPRGWAFCNGQLLSIQQNTALFAILGTTYGGNGVSTFGLPDLRGRIPLHWGNNFTIGELTGEEQHTITFSEMAQHSHVVSASSGDADSVDPTGVLPAVGPSAYDPGNGPLVQMALAVGGTGGSQPHQNLSPYLVLSFIIALQGIFPSRN